MKRNRFIVFATFVIAGIILILTSQFLDDDFKIVAVLCFALSAVTLVSALLDPHLNDYLRLATIVVGLLFLIAFATGLLVTEENMPVSVFCLIFAILEIVNGVFEMNEAIGLIKEKNYVMGALFVIDSIIELVLGVLMSIERHSTLRTHVILISADLFFEGTIKLINEYIEERRGVHE